MRREQLFLRQLDILSPKSTSDVRAIVIGAGGIGSPTVLTLAKMGIPRIEVWDPDTVEVHNLPNQLYRPQDIGKLKVVALAEIVKEFTGVEVIGVPAGFRSQSRIEPPRCIVLSGVDSMSTRESIWRSIKRNRPMVHRYIEARMGAEVGWVQVVDPADRASCDRYEATLYRDEHTFDDPCTARAIWYNAVALASVIGRLVKRIVREEDVEQEIIFDFGRLQFVTG